MVFKVATLYLAASPALFSRQPAKVLPVPHIRLIVLCVSALNGLSACLTGRLLTPPQDAARFPLLCEPS